jgi:hypothetical protein
MKTRGVTCVEILHRSDMIRPVPVHFRTVPVGTRSFNLIQGLATDCIWTAVGGTP